MAFGIHVQNVFEELTVSIVDKLLYRDPIVLGESAKVLAIDGEEVFIGLCKKDFINQRKLEKGAFYNCFVIILRVKINYVFNEYHIKVFNTGKLELPGIKNDEELQLIINKLLIKFS